MEKKQYSSAGEICAKSKIQLQKQIKTVRILLINVENFSNFRNAQKKLDFQLKQKIKKIFCMICNTLYSLRMFGNFVC